MPITAWATLSKILEEALDSYNEINAVMNLVLFEAAMQHMYVHVIVLVLNVLMLSITHFMY